jgi:amidase
MADPVPESSDLTFATASELLKAMADGEVSAVELTAAAIARIEALDGEINAICAPDFVNARAAAHAADGARARGDSRPFSASP